MAFAGAIEFDKKRLFFFASLFESRILFMTLDGGMGLLLGWGDDADVRLYRRRLPSALQPAAAAVPEPGAPVDQDPQRRQPRWCASRPTSPSPATPCRSARSAQLRFGFDDFGIEGHFGFDALFQFSPFYFIIEVNVSLRLNVFGLDVLSVRVELSLEGPTPWRARGTGHVSLLFFEISADFDVTWGESAETTLPPIAVVPLLRGGARQARELDRGAAAGQQPAGVAATAETDAAAELVMHPLGTLRVSQRLLPLDLSLDKVGTQKPSDAKRFELAGHRRGAREEEATRASNSRWRSSSTWTTPTKLSRPSFEPGRRLASSWRGRRRAGNQPHGPARGAL